MTSNVNFVTRVEVKSVQVWNKDKTLKYEDQFSIEKGLPVRRRYDANGNFQFKEIPSSEGSQILIITHYDSEDRILFKRTEVRNK